LATRNELNQWNARADERSQHPAKSHQSETGAHLADSRNSQDSRSKNRLPASDVMARFAPTMMITRATAGMARIS